MNPMNLFAQFIQNPMAMLMKRFNLPQNLNDPNEILNHLIKTGQVTQSQVDQAKQMLSNLGMRKP